MLWGGVRVRVREVGKVWGNHCTVRNCEKWEMWLSIRDNVAVELFERRVKDGAQMLVGADEAVCCAQLSRRQSVCVGKLSMM